MAINYQLMQQKMPGLKAALTRAQKADDPVQVLAAVEKALDVFDEVGAYPDNWHTFNIALNDAYFAFTRKWESGYAIEDRFRAAQARMY